MCYNSENDRVWEAILLISRYLNKNKTNKDINWEFNDDKL